MRPSQTFHEAYTRSAYAPYVHAHKLAGSMGQFFEMAQPPGDFSDPPVSDLVIVRTVSDGVDQSANLGGGRFVGRSPVGSLFIVAPETATDIVVRNHHVIRCLAIPAAFLRPHLEEARAGDPLDFGRLHAGPFQNRLVLDLLDRLWEEAGCGGAPSRIFADAAIVAMTAELLREAERPLPVRRGGLAPWQARRVTEYLQAHLAEDITLAELSALVELSPHHFCRAFKQSTGAPPHTWLLQARVERARELLADPRLSLTEIALSVGYGSQSAFGTAFRRVAGVTPSQWRREHGP